MPSEQRPSNELQELKSAQLYSWVRPARSALSCTASAVNAAPRRACGRPAHAPFLPHASHPCTHTHATRWPDAQATLPLSSYVQRLVLVFGGFFALIGGPVAYQTFDPYDQVQALGVREEERSWRGCQRVRTRPDGGAAWAPRVDLCVVAAQPLEWGLSAAVGSLVVVTLLGVRIYLGWSYVQERLIHP